MHHTQSIKPKRFCTNLLFTLAILFFLSQNTLVEANPSNNNTQNQENSHEKTANTISLILKKHPIAFISSIIGSVLVGVIIGIRYMPKKNNQSQVINNNQIIDSNEIIDNNNKGNTSVVNKVGNKDQNINVNINIPSSNNPEKNKALEEAKKLISLASSQGLKGGSDDAITEYEEAKNIVKNAFGANHIKYGETLNKIGNTLFWEKEQDMRAYKYYTAALPIYKEHLGINHEDYLTLLKNIAHTHIEAEKYEQALKVIEGNLNTQEHEAYGDILQAIGENFFWRKKNYIKARAYYTKALQVYKKTPNPECILSDSILLQKIANTYTEEEKYEEALKVMEDNLKTQDHQAYGNILEEIANKLLKSKKKEDYIKARKYYTQALPIFKKNLGPKAQHYASLVWSTAFTNVQLGEYEKALNVVKRSNLNKEHLVYGQILNQIGIALYKEQCYNEAYKYFIKALPFYKDNIRQEYPDYVTLIEDIALTHVKQKQYEEALNVVTSNLKEKYPTYAVILNHIGLHAFSDGDYTTARKYFKEALPLFYKQHPGYTTLVFDLAKTHIQEGKYQEAINVIEKNLKKDHEQNPNILSKIALFYRENQKYDEAIKNYEEILKIYENQAGKKSKQYTQTLKAIEETKLKKEL